MHTVTATRIWQTTLGSDPKEDSHADAREKLRASFVSFRERAALLAAEIHRDLPEFTVHDVTHLDALWEIADIVGGPELSLSPPEAFVLGGAFLLHDLGMSLASYPQGIEELKQRKTWNDTIALQFIEKHNRQPTPEELAEPSIEAVTAATAHLLRALHAEQAERLGMAAWTAPGAESPEHLIQDTDIRQTYGRIVGLIAHSHWWPAQELEKRFPRTLGAPHWCPKEWTVDPLKLSCLLRLADAGHIDARRAPHFLRTIRHVSAASSEHWTFQQRIGKPHVMGDALSYTSGHAFPFDESASWWLCFDTLRMVDEELRSVDALLADKGIHRFAARRVAGIESPERLTSYVPTAGWSPVDASVQVSDVPRLLTCLGGKELYGQNPKVPLRELIQNASDAVRARRAIEHRPEGWGEIAVRLGQDGERHWLEVDDNGIGMSPSVLTKHLLDFSTTFWGSSAMVDELPGLLGSGFRPTGKYGIGFFSVFMLGDSVRVRTRRADAAQKDTLVLEFNTGLSSRPVLREAAPGEVLRDGGTTVRVWLHTAPSDKGGLLWRFGDDPPTSLAHVCREVCPALPVTVICDESGATTRVVTGGDWVDCPGEDLFSRTSDDIDDDHESDEDCGEFLARAAANLRLITDPDGVPLARACVGLRSRSGTSPSTAALGGVVAIGGLRACRLSGIAGVLIGTSERAARDHARPVVPAEALSAWATEQASLVPSLYNDPDDQLECAGVITRCGGGVASLPVAQHENAYVCVDEIRAMTLPDEVLIVATYLVREFVELNGFAFVPGVFVTQCDTWKGILQVDHFWRAEVWPDTLFSAMRPVYSVRTTLAGNVIEAVAQSWGRPADELVRQIRDRGQRREERIVGHFEGQEIKRRVLALTNPGGAGTAKPHT
ncbi:MAG: ATP-binding protein [Planctomycetes bacterium]|nr:ATP-binding protein [Planctomycetota bacterium]